MVNQATNAGLNALFSSNSNTTENTSKSSSNRTESFNNYMNQSLESSNKKLDYKQGNDYCIKDNVKSDVKSSSTYNKKDSLEKTRTDKHDVKKTSNDDSNIKENDNAVDSKDTHKVSSDSEKSTNKTNKVDDNLTEKASKLEEDIKGKIEDILGISKEELEDIMSKLGLTILDLFNVNNLKQLTLAVNKETDITSILTDEGIGNQWNQLLTTIVGTDLEKDYDISKEQLQMLLDKAKVSQQMNQENVTVVDTKPEDSIDLGKDNKVQENVLIQADSNKKDITIEVNKETDVVKTSEKTSEETGVMKSQSTDSNNMSDSNTFSNQKGQHNSTEMTANPLETLVNNLVGGVNQTNNFVDQLSKVSEMREIVNQVVEQIKVNIKTDSTSMQFQLNPENLGKVNLTVTAKNGILTAQFVVENQAVKEAIESQMHVLRENLENQGVKVEAVEVTVSNFAFDQSNEANSENEDQKKSGKRKLSLDQINALMDDSEEVEDTGLMSSTGIDYIA